MVDDAVREYLSKLGKRGAAATNSKLTAAQRTKSAVRAARARWRKNDAMGEVLHDLKALQRKELERKRRARLNAKKAAK